MQTSEQYAGTSCLKVSSKSSPASVAGAIAGMVKDGVPVEMQAVGAGAVNQAIKAIAISRGFLSPVGIEIACVPSFADIIIDGDRIVDNSIIQRRYHHRRRVPYGNSFRYQSPVPAWHYG